MLLISFQGIQVYMDGEFVGNDVEASTDNSAVQSPDAHLILGKSQNWKFHGSIDELYIWEEEITPAYISMLYSSYI